MLLSAGDAACTTGVSGAVYSSILGDAGLIAAAFPGGFVSPADTVLKAMCYEQAVGVVSQLTPDAWHNVGAAGEPVFQNSWQNQLAGTNTVAAFCMDRFGWVHIKGIVKTGAPPSTIFTLPPAYWPPEVYNLATISNSLLGMINILQNGQVQATIGNSAWFSIDNIHFRVG